jgi:magnesium chelatase subunit D
VTHPARFLLVGTMNPEEGDLRPQLLDRFGLMVVVAGARDPELRTEVVRRRLAFEKDPGRFQETWHDEQQALRERILAGQKLLPEVEIHDGLVNFICRLCCEMDVDGLRADLVMNKTARALAAFQGRLNVTLDDIRAAAELVLPHRRRRKPFERPGLDPQRLDEFFREQANPNSTPPQPREADGNRESPDENDGEPRVEARDQVFEPARSHAVTPIEVITSSASAAPAPGRRNGAAAQRSGHYVRAVAGGQNGDLAVDATVRAAARRGGIVAGKLDIQPVDFHQKKREGKTGTLILFVVDSSGSMAARERMAAVKGAVVSLLQSAYEQRDQVSLITFQGVAAEVLLEPTRSVERAEQALRELPTGGRTPLAHALCLAQEVLARARRSHPELPVLLVAISDGKANVPLPDIAGDPWNQSQEAAVRLASAHTPALVLDSEAGFVRLGRAKQLADALAAEYMALEQLTGQDLVLKIRQMI